MNHHPLKQSTRRQFFESCGVGLGKIALGSLLADVSARAAKTAFPPRATMFGARAKRVIFLFQAGAPSQLELFDHKPKLRELAGKPIPPSVIAGQRYAFIQPDAAVLAPQFEFSRHGQSGAELSDRLPHLAKIADEIAIVKSLNTDQFNHAPAQIMVNTGAPIPGRPALGSWLSYGLGSVSQNLPSFVVLKSGGSVSGGAAMWSAGFLPGSHAGVLFRSSGDPILNTAHPEGFDHQSQ
ncbi:MAG: sulfatase, partial [Pedosphaera sp.]|nr:sulfatase [Pedosphaera sp.]